MESDISISIPLSGILNEYHTFFFLGEFISPLLSFIASNSKVLRLTSKYTLRNQTLQMNPFGSSYNRHHNILYYKCQVKKGQKPLFFIQIQFLLIFSFCLLVRLSPLRLSTFHFSWMHHSQRHHRPEKTFL